MAITHTRLLQFYQNFGKFYTWQFTPLLERTGLSMREMNVLLFLANNPQYDTARDVTEFRGLSKSQVSQAVELLVAEGLVSRTPDSSGSPCGASEPDGGGRTAGPGGAGAAKQLCGPAAVRVWAEWSRTSF